MHNDQPHPTEDLSMDAFLAQESIELHKADLARKDAEIMQSTGWTQDQLNHYRALAAAD